MMTAAAFLERVETFIKERGISATAFGRSAVNDPNFVGDLRNGRMPSLATAERINTFMDQAKRTPSEPEAA